MGQKFRALALLLRAFGTGFCGFLLLAMKLGQAFVTLAQRFSAISVRFFFACRAPINNLSGGFKWRGDDRFCGADTATQQHQHHRRRERDFIGHRDAAFIK